MKQISYPPVAKAEWPLRLPDGLPAGEVDLLRRRADELAGKAQYGWGHTIDFGPFAVEGLLGDKYLVIAGALDEWSWWPRSLASRRVADIGCYSGGLALLMAARGADVVYAVDEIGAHLDQCSFLATTFQMNAVKSVHASLYDLGATIEPGTLEVVVLAGVLYHLSDMLVGLVAAQELLAPGGTLILESSAVECFEHSYANFGRFVGGMWWQPTALCIVDLCEFAGLTAPEVRFYRPGRALARAVKTDPARVSFKRGMNRRFPDLRDERPRPLDLAGMAPAPCSHAQLGMVSRWLVTTTQRAARLPLSLVYLGRRLRRRR